MSDDDIERLELKISYLERANQELSDVVYRQQQQLDELRARVASLAVRLDGGQVEQRAATVDEERPPHY